MMLHDMSPWISELQHLLWQRDSEAVVEHMKKIVPEYRASTLAADAAVPAKPEVVLTGAKLDRPKLLRV
jgi:hypothetical protein